MHPSNYTANTRRIGDWSSGHEESTITRSGKSALLLPRSQPGPASTRPGILSTCKDHIQGRFGLRAPRPLLRNRKPLSPVSLK
jgi:hypothetical protein